MSKKYNPYTSCFPVSHSAHGASFVKTKGGTARVPPNWVDKKAEAACDHSLTPKIHFSIRELQRTVPSRALAGVL